MTIELANETVGVDNAERLEPAQYVAISVRDNGSGMEPEVAASAFEPFFTTKPVGKGSGLGLSQVYGFARQSGGCVRLQTEVGHGTTITIVLPCATQTEAEPDDTRQAAGNEAAATRA